MDRLKALEQGIRARPNRSDLFLPLPRFQVRQHRDVLYLASGPAIVTQAAERARRRGWEDFRLWVELGHTQG